MQNRQQIIRQENVVTDITTGEALSSTVTSIYKEPKEPSFVKMYVQDIALLHSLPKTAMSLLVEISTRINYQNEFYVTSRVRKEISDKIGCAEKTIKNNITKLQEVGLIRKISNQEYELNPIMFGKGHWDTICKKRDNFKLEITYNENGRTIKQID